MEHWITTIATISAPKLASNAAILIQTSGFPLRNIRQTIRQNFSANIQAPLVRLASKIPS
jgi:hypothetical protein